MLEEEILQSAGGAFNTDDDNPQEMRTGIAFNTLAGEKSDEKAKNISAPVTVKKETNQALQVEHIRDILRMSQENSPRDNVKTQASGMLQKSSLSRHTGY